MLMLVLVSLTSYGQLEEMEAKNGWAIAPYGRLHVLVVFAEINFDGKYGNLDPTPAAGNKDWKAGKLPWWKEKMFSRKPDGKGYMTKYFRQASFGKFRVTGDYLDTLITINITDIKDRNGRVVTRDPYGNGHYRGAVVNRVHKMPWKTGFGSKPEYFDHWKLTSTGMPKVNEPNGNFDMVMIIWRNIHVRNLGNNSGFVSQGNIGKIHGDMGTDSYSMFRMSNFIPYTIMRHEFSHMLYGGNNFHNASGGVGTHSFLTGIGGWSNMSNDSRCSEVWNAWDRERMNWKHPDHKYLISARNGDNMKEAPGELVYGEPLANEDGHYVLRDFVKYGDAIKIKLPHIPAGINNQYLWLENHQKLKGNIDHEKIMVKGLYGFITTGKDHLTGTKTFAGNNNYGFVLVGSGNHDWEYSDNPRKDPRLILDPAKSNPFTGYHQLMGHLLDFDGSGTIDLVPRGKNRAETMFPNVVVKNGVEMPKEYYNYRTFPMYGNTDIAFTPDRYNKIGISYNPAAVPVYTHTNPGGPRKFDNRRIYLNGISVEILKQDDNGDLHIKVRWDDFDIVDNPRWCGNIVSNETIRILSGRRLFLDWGRSTQVTKMKGVVDGDTMFAEPTILELKSGSRTVLKPYSRIVVENGSSLLVRAGSKMFLEKGARVVVEEGAHIWVEKGAYIETADGAGFEYKDDSVGINEVISSQFNDRISHEHPIRL